MVKLTIPGDPNTHNLADAISALSARWALFVALGIILLILGGLASAYVMTAALIQVTIVGLLMLAGGVSQLIHSWRVLDLRGFLFWGISGLLYCAAGILAIQNPPVGAAVLTLLLGASLIGTGAFRLWLWFNNRAQRGWKWVAFSALITLAAGLLIAVDWPENSLLILGLLLALDLFIQGWALLLLGIALRRSHRR
jgi:uncharacterized membrane protein HdeD (DUF308 family)